MKRHLTLLRRFLAFLVASSALVLSAVGAEKSPSQHLTEQAAQFPEKVIKIADGIYTAVGYSVSNSSMIVGEEGVIIIYTGMDLARGEKVVEQIRKITDRPLKAIVFTHSHGDHTGGAAAFLSAERRQIWARANVDSEALPSAMMPTLFATSIARIKTDEADSR